jgi:hypothetical protein
MALIYFNGFDYYNNDGEIHSEPEWSADSIFVDMVTDTRFGAGRSFRITSTFSAILDLGSEYTTLVIGCAAKFGTFYTNYGNPFISLRDSSNAIQLEIFICNGSQRKFTIARGDSGANILCTESTEVWQDNMWYYYEFKVVIHDSTGSVEARRNEQTICSASSVDTKETSNTGVRYLHFSYVGGGMTTIDDLYVEDTNFLGDVRVKTFYPDSDGTHSDFTRSTGSNDYECVDDSQPNDDTDYIESSTVSDKSTFGITTGSLSTVHGIKVGNRMKKTDAGAKQVRLLLRSNGTDYTGDTEDALDSWSRINKIYLTDPDDSNAWTQAKLEACEYGIEHVS